MSASPPVTPPVQDSRDRRTRAVSIAVVVLALAAALGAALLRGSYRDAPYEPDNPGRGGSKAVVQVLGDIGVDVRTVRRTQEAADALRRGERVLVTEPSTLSRAQLEALRGALAEGEGDLVLVRPDFGSLTVLAPGVAPTGTVPEDAEPLRADARCGDASLRARAVNAGPVGLDAEGARIASGLLYAAPRDARSCFRLPAGASVVRSGSVTILGSARYVTNEGVRGADDAAIALNALGDGTGALTWYVPSATDPMAARMPSLTDRLPPATGPIALWLALTVLLYLAALSWRAGPVVVEPLPITVRAQELTVGRAHLMRRAGARDRAAQALRSATAVRLAHRVGVPRRHGLDELIAALSPHLAAGTRDPASLRRLLGPEPVDTDDELVRLAHDLDRLTEEIER